MFASTFVSFDGKLAFWLIVISPVTFLSGDVINNDHPMIIQREIVILYPRGLERMSQIRYERKIISAGNKFRRFYLRALDSCQNSTRPG